MKKFIIKNGGKTYRVKASDSFEAIKKLRDYQKVEVSQKRIEAVPFEARQYLRSSKNPEASILGILSNLDDIIEAAEPSIRPELKMKKEKILKDLCGQFGIDYRKLV